MSRILLCAGASVALYKSCDLASNLAQAGHEVRTVLTPNAAKLIDPQLFEAVTGQPAASTEFGDGRRGAMDHIDAAQSAELVLVAPCTADLAGRMANGLGDDLVTTSLLATAAGIPRLLCPAMNPNMLANPAVARNLSRLREDGWEVLEPEEGHMACGVNGRGRFPAPQTIADRVRALLAS
jgi:phosphopantothenoylcysteine decarboxylase / phosphopantothenate---cysteine ligase